MSLFKIIHIDKLTVYRGPDLLESSPLALGFMNQGESPISGFQHYKKKVYHVSTRRLSLCGPSQVFLSSPRLYENIVFV